MEQISSPSNFRTRTETQVERFRAIPNIGVAFQKILCGHIELKAIGKGANIDCRCLVK